MGSESSSPKLLFLDFSKPEVMTQGSPEWETLRSQVREALQEYGCFEASYDDIPSHARSAIFGATKELFELPLETKLRNVSEKPFYGYIGQVPGLQLYESLGIDDADVSEKVETFTNTLWPQGNPSFCKTIHSYAEQLSKLDKIVRTMIGESFGLDKYMDEHFDSTNYLLRVMKYNCPNNLDNIALGMNSHTDKNIVTILLQNQVEGLEVQTKDGSWIKFQPSSPTSFIVIIGEALNAWLNGRLYSPYHRVMMTGNEVRYSLGLFSVPKAGYMIKAPEEVVDKQHPLVFKPYDHAEFLSFYHTEAGRRATSALHAYCGI
ncbi:unnamed protein product [Linum tenue]|uniref:Fe2OG dioxygenase domain-containing protein n=1 Tax=Linum tenue TaxID=586396 RepID=A0AAV0PVT0_9ROSI|nr:unnamed protein product [Linum tenue]